MGAGLTGIVVGQRAGGVGSSGPGVGSVENRLWVALAGLCIHDLRAQSTCFRFRAFILAKRQVRC